MRWLQRAFRGRRLQLSVRLEKLREVWRSLRCRVGGQHDWVRVEGTKPRWERDAEGTLVYAAVITSVCVACGKSVANHTRLIS